MIAVAVVFLVRPARRRPVPPRIVIGGRVLTDEGLAGTVDRLDGAFALVRTDDGHQAWVRSDRLMEGATEASTIELAGDPAAQPAPSPAHLGDAGSGFARFAEGVWNARHTVAWGWVVVVLACLPLAATAQKSFTDGGFLYEDGEAVRALDEIADEFQMPISQQTMLVAGPIDRARARVAELTPAVMRVDHVAAIGTPRPSTDGRLVAVDVYLDGPDGTTMTAFEPLRHHFQEAFPERPVQVAGTPATYIDTTEQTARDLKRAEMIGIPLALLVLLVVFGTVISAVVPLLVGVASVVVTLAILHLLSLPLGLSLFVLNIATMLGFGLGIDYSLLGVTRFRDELDRGVTVREAVITTIVASGRAATISGVAVLAGVAALAAIPLPIMFAIAIGGVVVVAVSVIASITLLPAMLALLGHRVERLAVRRRRPPGEVTTSRWYRVTHLVMRHPGMAAVLGVAILLALASPIRGAHLDVPHDEVLPPNAPSMVAKRLLESRFAERVEMPAVVIADTADPAKLDALRTRLLTVDHLRRTEVLKVDEARDRTMIYAWGDASMALGGPVARDVALELRALDTPVDIVVTGQGAGEAEFLQIVRERMPHTLLLMFVSTFLILTIAFRSFTLPLKAIVLDTLSILASLGVIVAVFQDGVGMQLLGGDALGYTESTIPIILFCLLFGLSMDYEVFMLAKVTELYQEGHDSQEATARGVASTAPLVTGAALILIVIGIAFATTQLVLVKQIGFGMAVALFLDATIVRVLLLPATMKLLGPANWWLPRRLQRRIPRLEWAH